MKITASLLTIFLFTTIFFSCKKENVDPRVCTGSCKTVRLIGKVFDVSSNEGVKNAEVNAHFYQWKKTCFYCFDEPVETFAKTTTDDFGRFDFGIIVDSEIFKEGKHYSLSVSANTNNYYISGNYVSFDKYEEQFSNIVLKKYKKAKLNIIFKRDSLDAFSSYAAYYSFNDNLNGVTIEPINQTPIFTKLFSLNIPDSSVMTFTGANFWTKIKGSKFSTTGVMTKYIDSIFCNAYTINNITIKY